MTDRQQRLLTATGCDVRFDNLTRQLYATDASLYQIVPAAVAFPRTAEEAWMVIRAAAEAELPLIPRGAGTGLVGGALGEGLILEFARHQDRIFDLDLENRTVRVEPGVVLDQLNAFLKPHGLTFGPDVATSSRATLGGMIANNSSGAHVPVYGTTADHVRSLEVLLADGRRVVLDRNESILKAERERLHQLIVDQAGEIHRRMPEGLSKRWPGYGIDRWLRAPGHLPDLMAGSEGTLAAIVSAELNLVPLPRRKGLGLIFFASLTEAMQATVELLDLRPAALEHIDRHLFDQTKGQLPFQAARDLLELDVKPCESVLMVEFFEDIDERLAALEKRALGQRRLRLTKSGDMNRVWALRKAGLSLLTSRAGPAKPVTAIEDTAVRPQQLPEYVAGLKAILDRLDLEACFYGHAASGLLHVRPVLDPHQPGDLVKLRQVANEVSALVRQFRGSLAGEHGVGIARTEFMEDHLGPDLLALHREIKTCFDPHQRFNPGKILSDGRYRLDTHLRQEPAHPIPLPFQPRLAFAAKDHSFVANLEQCNGCGGCRKAAPTMCPTFVVTREEILSTRGRANAIRAVLEGRTANPLDPLVCAELEAALSECLSCKACTTECPSNVNLSLLKAELLHARHRRHGLPWKERFFSAADLLGRAGSLAPGLANRFLDRPWFKRFLHATLGLSPRRPLPAFAPMRFDRWFHSRPAARSARSRTSATHGPVLLWDDTFVRYHEPNIGKAAVAVLEAAGYEVQLLERRRCCGRPAFSQGHLDRAHALGSANLELLRATDAQVPIVFLEPSCYSMFVEDYRELRLPGAESVAQRCFLFESFLDRRFAADPEALTFTKRPEPIAIHAHCHAKSLLDLEFLPALLGRVTESNAALLNTGCCGMAGAFGFQETHYDLSCRVAQPLVQQLAAQPAQAIVAASGTSCRQQIAHLTAFRPQHPAEILASAIRSS